MLGDELALWAAALCAELSGAEKATGDFDDEKKLGEFEGGADVGISPLEGNVEETEYG